MSEELWLALTGSVEPFPCFGGLASQSFELLHRPSDKMLALRVYVGLRVAGTGRGHYVTRMPRASKLVGLVKPWALRLSTMSVGAFDSAVGGPVAVVPGEDLV